MADSRDVVHTRSGATLHLGPEVVEKVHRAGTDPDALRRRLEAAEALPALLSPLSTYVELRAGRCVTRWPRVPVLDPEDAGSVDAVPWTEFGRLLAGLHRAPVPDGLPPAEPWARLDRALARLGQSADADVVRSAAAALPRPGTGTATPDRVVHGDLHAGQLARGPGGWVLLDVDDLGYGDPVHDLARPAGFWAAGLLADGDWETFLAAYVGAGGPAVDPADPWDRLEVPARAAVITAAAQSLDPSSPAAAARDDLVAACRRMPGSVA